MRKVFIDCGAWEGISSKYFRETFPNAEEYEIYAFECNSRLIPKIKELSYVNVIEKAVWTYDGKIDLFLGSGEFTESSSVIKTKTTGNLDKNNPDHVDCLDFSKWIRDNFKKEDYIVCKMNIEGGEYDVLNKMIEDGTIHYMNVMFIDWHWKKIKMDKNTHDKLLKTVQEFVELDKWALYHDKHSNVRNRKFNVKIL
jgi:FkbM family methyltransferase